MDRKITYIVAIVYRRLDNEKIYVNQQTPIERASSSEEALGLMINKHLEGWPPGEFCILDTNVFMIDEAIKDNLVIGACGLEELGDKSGS